MLIRRMFQNLNLKFKLLIMVAVPVIGLLWFSQAEVRLMLQKKDESEAVLQLVDLSVRASALVHELQKERGASAGYLGSQGQKFQTELPEQRQQTDPKREELLRFLDSFSSEAFGEEFKSKLDLSMSMLAELDDKRGQISNLAIPGTEAIGYFTTMHAAILDVISGLPKLSSNGSINNSATAYVNYLLGKERAGIERAVMSNTFALDHYGDGVYRKFANLVSEQETYMNVFVTLASPPQKAFYREKMGDPIVVEVQRMRDIAFNAGSQSEGFGVDSVHWFSSITSKINLLKEVENRLSEDFVTLARAERDQANADLMTVSLITFGALVLTVVFCWFLSSLITNSIMKSVSLADRIANGDLGSEIEVTGNDETGQLLGSMKTMQSRLSNVIENEVQPLVSAAGSGDLSRRIELNGKQGFYHALSESINDLVNVSDLIVSDTATVVSAMAQGDLSRSIDTEYQGRFNELKRDINHMQDQLRLVIEQDVQTIVSAAGNGDLSRRIDLEGKDGFYGELAGSINDLVDVNDRIINDTVRVIGQMAEGNLKETIDADYQGSFGQLKADVSRMQEQLTKAIEQDIQPIVAAAGEGDLSQRIELSGKHGFYHDLASSINNLVDVNDRVISDVVVFVESMTNGDLTQKVEANYKGRFGHLLAEVNRMQVKLVEVIEHEIRPMVDRAGQGDLSDRISVVGKQGFYEELASSINDLVDVNERVVDDTVAVVSSMANGDLSRTIDADYLGSFQQLQDGVNGTIEKLVEVVTEIKSSASQVKSGAGEIASGNTNLSQRTEEQAASLEETSSAMEQMTSTIQQNASNASAANELALNAKDTAEKGGSAVDDAVSAMVKINDSSREISEIIGVIDEIAFQTNLLALNASVEAARAGDQGRGFAVVADEVRNLAGRSATAAKEIKELIQDSSQKVEEGSRMVDRSGETLQDIVSSVKKVSDIIAEISASSAEQAAGVHEVNRAISQMDEMTQQNAALVEEAAAASESLGDQAEVLDDLIGFFSVEKPTGNIGGLANVHPISGPVAKTGT